MRVRKAGTSSAWMRVLALLSHATVSPVASSTVEFWSSCKTMLLVQHVAADDDRQSGNAA
jgi:hypothetical protein